MHSYLHGGDRVNSLSSERGVVMPMWKQMQPSCINGTREPESSSVARVTSGLAIVSNYQTSSLDRVGLQTHLTG